MTYQQKRDFPICQCSVRKNQKGKFFIVIVTSGRHLHWPYSAKSEPPFYLTRRDCNQVIKEYIRFVDTTQDRYKRYETEFEVVNIEEERLKN